MEGNITRFFCEMFSLKKSQEKRAELSSYDAELSGFKTDVSLIHIFPM